MSTSRKKPAAAKKIPLAAPKAKTRTAAPRAAARSEEHMSELQSLV